MAAIYILIHLIFYKDSVIEKHREARNTKFEGGGGVDFDVFLSNRLCSGGIFCIYNQ